jgi:hypothetical protein
MTSHDVSPTVYLAYQRARAAAISARAETALGRLGGKTATHRGGSRESGTDWLTRGLSAAEIDKDSAFIRQLLSLWKRNSRARPRQGTGVVLPSGRRFIFRPGEGIVRPWSPATRSRRRFERS